jgi:hypothetical protein
MRHALAMLGVALLAACAGTEVTVLVGPRSVDGDSAPGAMLNVSRRIGEHGICSYVHLSDPSSGRPFNDNGETNDDIAGCGWTWRRGP